MIARPAQAKAGVTQSALEAERATTVKVVSSLADAASAVSARRQSAVVLAQLATWPAESFLKLPYTAVIVAAEGP